MANSTARLNLPATRMEKLFDIVHEDDALLVINKPADLVCHPTKGDVYSSLISRVRLHLGPSIQPQLINRLDRETSGLVLVGKSAEAALELRRALEGGHVDKRYYAIVHGPWREAFLAIDAPLGKDDASAVAIKNTVRADGAAARTEVTLLRTFDREGQPFSLLEARPITGRKHQIRIHLAHHGHAIVGDKLYGADENFYLDFVLKRQTAEQRRALLLANHALHAHRLAFAWRGAAAVFRAPPDRAFLDFLPADLAEVDWGTILPPALP